MKDQIIRINCKICSYNAIKYISHEGHERTLTSTIIHVKWPDSPFTLNYYKEDKAFSILACQAANPLALGAIPKCRNDSKNCQNLKQSLKCRLTVYLSESSFFSGSKLFRKKNWGEGKGREKEVVVCLFLGGKYNSKDILNSGLEGYFVCVPL